MASIVVSGDTSGAVTITAPAIAGTTTLTLPTTSGTIVTTGGAASLTTSGNLTFTGTGNRITGDFSNATFANRVAFQTSTLNGNTGLIVLTNGTGGSSAIRFFGSSDTTNGAFLNLAIGFGAGVAAISSDAVGTGTYQPLTMLTGGSERLRIDTSGNLLVGTTTTRNKLTVAGTATNTPTLGTASGASLFAGTDMNYGMMFGVGGSGNGWIQQQRVDGTATAYDLLLQPSGGNVGVGVSPAVRFDVQGTSNQLRVSTGAANSFYGLDAGAGKCVFKDFTDASEAIELNNSGFINFTTASSERMRIDSSGNVNINTAGVYLRLNAASTTFDFSGQAGATDFLRINANGTQRFQFNSAGQAYNSTGTWGTISDARLKENIADATPKLDSINQLRVVNFNFKDEPDVKQIGFIAQEVEQVFPGLVSEGADDGDGGYYKAVKTTVLIPMLVKAIQEQQAIIEELKARIETLEAK